jgi:hypothetical protein
MALCSFSSIHSNINSSAPPPLPPPEITTGNPTISTISPYAVYTYRGSGSITFNTSKTVNYIIVGGGGGGGGGSKACGTNNATGGSGGSGGYVITGSTTVIANTLYNITIGSGGLGYGYVGPNDTTNKGSSSSFGTITAFGGIYGNYGNDQCAINNGNKPGNQNGTNNYGKGGEGSNYGLTNTDVEQGQKGLTVSIGSTNFYYGGGGGGGTRNEDSYYNNNFGTQMNADYLSTNYGVVYGGGKIVGSATFGSTATANTGGGGGGGGYNSSNTSGGIPGGNGGSGICIIYF